MQNMTSNQPYLLRAFYDWLLDNELTPYMVVDVNFPGVQVPTQFVKDDQIVLNVSPSACVNFNMSLEWVEFQARFSGQAMTVSFPCHAVGAIYAKENGAGTVFTLQDRSVPDEPHKKPQSIGQSEPQKPTLHAAPPPSKNSGDTPSPSKGGKKPGKKPGLHIVK